MTPPTSPSSCQLKQDNFDLDNIKMVSETTIEHDDSDYDHWEVTMFLPKSLKTRGEVLMVIDKILHDQALANELRRTHDFYLESKNGMCAGVTHQILSLSNYGGKSS